ncbi:hypothetical protein BC834DRAFT_514757 [Gloeopeniophorella convolvens]|nr:hypothetical protein BC834DRAFT_514757 [Gloeopeniophorella convolvens]
MSVPHYVPRRLHTMSSTHSHRHRGRQIIGSRNISVADGMNTWAGRGLRYGSCGMLPSPFWRKVRELAMPEVKLNTSCMPLPGPPCIQLFPFFFADYRPPPPRIRDVYPSTASTISRRKNR